MSDRMDINRVLLEMRALKAQTQAFNELAPADTLSPKALNKLTATETTSNFGQLMEQAVDKVNALQQTSKQLSTAFEQGQSGVDITDVMIASQKASVSFQSMVQVRNKLVEAYRDVMNMPV
ncbi:MAG: flagellar hook-basal body complex protein FliE [Cellvibrionaceae bacterium]|nr:flagellar hook-basal body complex protein FliE [Cellvibrionaceae bacterium]